MGTKFSDSYIGTQDQWEQRTQYMRYSHPQTLRAHSSYNWRLYSPLWDVPLDQYPVALWWALR